MFSTLSRSWAWSVRPITGERAVEVLWAEPQWWLRLNKFHSSLHISTQVWLVSAAAQGVLCQPSLVANNFFFPGCALDFSGWWHPETSAESLAEEFRELSLSTGPSLLQTPPTPAVWDNHTWDLRAHESGGWLKVHGMWLAGSHFASLFPHLCYGFF